MALASSIPWWDVTEAGYETTNGSVISANPWDRVILDDTDYFPGVCTVDSKRTRKKHKKSPPAKDGGTVTMTGYDLADIKITCTIWTPGQLDELVGLCDRLFPAENRATSTVPIPAATKAAMALAGIKEDKSKKKTQKKPEPQPHSVYHPALHLLGINWIVFHDADALRPGSIAGSKTMTFSATEYRPPKKDKKAKATPTTTPVESGPPVTEGLSTQADASQAQAAPKQAPSEDDDFSMPDYDQAP